jgi:hypothetical protein
LSRSFVDSRDGVDVDDESRDDIRMDVEDGARSEVIVWPGCVGAVEPDCTV